jgi:hypothetical protein
LKRFLDSGFRRNDDIFPAFTKTVVPAEAGTQFVDQTLKRFLDSGFCRYWEGEAPALPCGV